MAKLEEYNKGSKKLSNVSYFTCVDENGNTVNIPITEISNITSANDGRITVLQNKTQYNQVDGTVSIDYINMDNDVDVNSNSLLNVVGLGFDNGQIISWNSSFHTLNIPTGLGSTLQVGQEFYFLIYNNTGSLIPNGTIVKPTGATLVGSEVIPTVILAKADKHDTCSGTLFLVTSDIEDGSVGVGLRTGRASGINTTGISAGAALFLSPDTAGAFTDTRPEFPNYALSIGGALKIGADGEVAINFTNSIYDTFNDAWDGCFRESIAFTISSDGVTVTGSLERNGGGDLTMAFSDGFTTLDCTPAKTVTLTAGTDTIPQMNYVYIPYSTKTLTASTAGFPDGTQHIKVADVLVSSATYVQNDYPLSNRNWNDHVKKEGDNGHLLHISERIRQGAAEWDDGVEGTCTVSAPTNSDVYVSVTAGHVYQLHRQTFLAQDTSVSDHVHVLNHNTTPYLEVSNLNSLTSDASGTTLANRSFSFVLWGVQNRSGTPSLLMINLPNGSYLKNNPDQAVADASGYSDYTIPKNFKGKGFLIARFTFVLASNGLDWTLYNTEDLRGKIPNSTAGGGSGGGGGVSSFDALLDTPSSKLGSEKYHVRVDSTGTSLEYVAIPAVETTTGSGIIDLSDGRTFHRTIATGTSFEIQNEEVCNFKIFMAATGAVSVASTLFTHATKSIVVISKYDTINSSFPLMIDCSILFQDATFIYVAYEIKQQ